MPKASELKSGMVVDVDGQPYVVRQVHAQNPSARGAATLYKTRLNHAGTGQKLDRSFKGDEFLADVDFQRRSVQYLYSDGESYTFMDVADYNQHSLGADQLEEVIPFLTDGAGGFMALLVEGVCVAVEPPPSVEMEIIETAPAMKGASQSARTKTAKLASGLEIQVPEYLAEGERVKINTGTREFMSRA